LVKSAAVDVIKAVLRVHNHATADLCGVLKDASVTAYFAWATTLESTPLTVNVADGIKQRSIALYAG
jgi:hypothetical protein